MRCSGRIGELVMRHNVAMRLLRRIAAVGMALLAAGCTAGTAHQAARSASPLPPDAHTAAALLTVATAFNHDYDTGDYAPVYARWDARSQAIISEADYVQRHKECPGAQAVSRTEDASPGSHGAWLVRYEVGGQQLTDYWFYAGRRWVFDIVLSNPDMVPLYRMPPQQYVKALGCAH
jgi:hypothetical protein